MLSYSRERAKPFPVTQVFREFFRVGVPCLRYANLPVCVPNRTTPNPMPTKALVLIDQG